MLTQTIIDDLNLGLERNCDTDNDCVLVLKAVLREALNAVPERKRRKVYGSATFQKAIEGISEMNTYKDRRV